MKCIWTLYHINSYPAKTQKLRTYFNFYNYSEAFLVYFLNRWKKNQVNWLQKNCYTQIVQPLCWNNNLLMIPNFERINRSTFQRQCWSLSIYVTRSYFVKFGFQWERNWKSKTCGGWNTWVSFKKNFFLTDEIINFKQWIDFIKRNNRRI